MKCKICNADCEFIRNSQSHYCTVYASPTGRVGHYARFIDSSGASENFIYGYFQIQMHFDTESICTHIFIYKMNKPYEKMTHINISKEAFEKMNFDPKNPKTVLDKLELLKCFY